MNKTQKQEEEEAADAETVDNASKKRPQRPTSCRIVSCRVAYRRHQRHRVAAAEVAAAQLRRDRERVREREWVREIVLRIYSRWIFEVFEVPSSWGGQAKGSYEIDMIEMRGSFHLSFQLDKSVGRAQLAQLGWHRAQRDTERGYKAIEQHAT